MEKLLDIVLIVVFTLVQWRITRLLLGAAERRLPGSARSVARAAIFTFDGLLIVGYCFTFSPLRAWLRIPGSLGLVMGATALTYLMTATAALGVHQVFAIFSKCLRADVNPGRRQVLYSVGSV